MRKADDSGPRVPPTPEPVPELDRAVVSTRPACRRRRQRQRREVPPVAVVKTGPDRRVPAGATGGARRCRLGGQTTACPPCRLPPLTRRRIPPPPRRPDSSTPSPRLRSAAPSFSVSSIVSSLLLSACLLTPPAAAVQIPFQNCLPNSYRYHDPTPLQWIPLHVDATFDTESPSHRLRMTMWGNVTGSFYTGPLPPPGSPDWSDPSKLDGKILDEPQPDAAEPKLTTLHNKVSFLTYQPWSENANFCNTSLTNASCPLGPVFNTADLSFPYSLPSVTMTHDFFSSFAFTSLSATFLILYGDEAGTHIGCVSAVATPDLGGLKWVLTVLPLAVLVIVGLATVFAGIFSPWGTTDVFHWTSNFGRDADLLRLVTPGFGDCLQYIQFIALTGGLTLNYPGFYQPITSQASWSALMFNQSFVSKDPGWQNLEDGLYVTDGKYGLHRLAQLVGMRFAEDIWVGMIVWLLGIFAGVLVVLQAGFLAQWMYKNLKRVHEEDLRAKNIPFSLGNATRIVFNYFLLPIVALSTFQLVVATDSPAYTVALAVITLALIVGFAGWLLYLIATTKPRAFLFDDLPTLLLYGPLYNTYSDEAAAFALIPVLLTFIRGIAVGAVQPIGIAQLVLLAICEVIHILTLHAVRPFHSPTSMNAYHTLFSALRLVTVLLMIAFVPSLGVDEGAKGWIGYAILLVHGAVLVLGFLLNAVQTIVEVLARMLGAGGDDVRGQTRGGLSKIFGMRQLAKRMSRREVGPSRQSQMSSSAMLDVSQASKVGYIMPSGRVRSESAGSMGAFMHHHRHTSSSAMDAMSFEGPVRHPDSGTSSFAPTPAEASTFSFLPSPSGPATRYPPPPPPHGGLPLQAADPYYRPPRARQGTLDSSSPPYLDKARGSWASGDQRRSGVLAGTAAAAVGSGDAADVEAHPERSATPAPYAQPPISLAPRTDYSTREVDFYYGVRGERLNSGAPNRKLGTGPADPTGPMASAAGWLRTFFGGKSKDKGKGFEVVRSARMPPAMRAGGGEFGDDGAPQGIPVAMGVLRNGPIESDEEEEKAQRKKGKRRERSSQGPAAESELLDADGTPHEDDSDDEVPRSHNHRDDDGPPMLPDLDRFGSIRMPSRIQSKSSRHAATRDDPDGDLPGVPEIPRKSSKRDSGGTPRHSRHASLTMMAAQEVAEDGHGPSEHLRPSTPSRLPFERTGSLKRPSSTSSTAVSEPLSEMELRGPPGVQEYRRTSYGYVSQGSISRVEREGDLQSSSAEVIDERR